MASIRWLTAVGLGFWTVVLMQSVAWRFYWTRFTVKPIRLDFIVRAELLMFGIAGFLTPGIVYAARRFCPGRASKPILLCIHMVGSVIFALTVKMLWDVAILPMYKTPWVMHFSWDEFQKSLMQGVQINAALYWVIVLGVTAIDHANQYRNVAIEAVELRAQLAEAQLQTLRIQLDPHFLFNTLNSVAELVTSEPVAAEVMIADLSELLRLSLAHRERHEIPLGDEMDFLRLYLAIQQRRFAGRLQVRYDIGAGATGAMVPSMLLQPLVENSIRHAIGPRRNGGSILIRAMIAGSALQLEVEDIGGMPAARPAVEGVGLRTTRERLQRLYGDAQQLELTPGAEGLRARIRLPFRRENADAA